MEKVTVADTESRSYGNDMDRRGLSDPLGTTDVAINHYRLGSGERLAGLHTHMDQEEVFIVVEGEATFETLNGKVSVSSGEVIRFAPGEYQSATNDSDDDILLYALGAPRGTEDWRVPLSCPECGHDNMRPEVTDGEHTLVCPDCDAELETNCPECGTDNRLVVLGDDGETPIDFCPDCGAESAVR